MIIKFSKKLHLVPTNKAIYQSLMCLEEKPYEQLIKRLLVEKESSILNQEYLLNWLGLDDVNEAILTFEKLRQLRLIKGSNEQSKLPDMAIDEALSDCVGQMAEQACMLANDEGFQLANIGFRKDHADELAAVAAELYAFHTKRVQKLSVKGVVSSDVWSILGTHESPSVTFRPVSTNHQNFILINKGPARFDNNGLLNLARILMNKYNQ